MIAGLGQASKLVTENIDKYNRHMEKVRDYLEERLKVRHEIYSSWIQLVIKYIKMTSNNRNS